MSATQSLDSAGARIVDRLHFSIASLIDGNHVERSEVVNAGGRSCPCHLTYEVYWTFVPYTSSRRVLGNGAVSTHFGYNQQGYSSETDHRCKVGRFHKPIRDGFMSQVLARGSAGLAGAENPVQIWDFGQHSVHEQCGRCHGGGLVTCSCNGTGRESCWRCGGCGSTTETRWVSGRNGHSHSESYQQTCYCCGGFGRVTCRQCGGSGDVQCPDCGGHGFFTDIMSVTVQAEPRVEISTQSEFSSEALSAYLVSFPVSQIVGYLDFSQSNHQDAAEDVWWVCYEVVTTVVQLDLKLRTKTYMAAAVGDKALAFIRPPIFDDVFIEELADLNKIWSGKKKTFSNARARKFFVTYAGQPVLDAAMKSVAKLQGQERNMPGKDLIVACDGYISNRAADLLGRSMIALLDKVSPPNSMWSWVGVMALPFLLLFTGAQNWFEYHLLTAGLDLVVVWFVLVLVAVLLTVLMSPIASFASTVVSFMRRRAVPPEYRQHGRNWQPFKRFILASVFVASVGAGLGILSHHGKLPRWDNAPLGYIEEVLNLNRFTTYVQTSAVLKRAGFFVSPSMEEPAIRADQVVVDIQSNLARLGYKVTVTGQMDEDTRRAVRTYAKKRRIKFTDPQSVNALLCKDLKGECANFSQIK